MYIFTLIAMVVVLISSLLEEYTKVHRI